MYFQKDGKQGCDVPEDAVSVLVVICC